MSDTDSDRSGEPTHTNDADHDDANDGKTVSKDPTATDHPTGAAQGRRKHRRRIAQLTLQPDPTTTG